MRQRIVREKIACWVSPFINCLFNIYLWEVPVKYHFREGSEKALASLRGMKLTLGIVGVTLELPFMLDSYGSPA